jgi:hypothetical protein
MRELEAAELSGVVGGNFWSDLRDAAVGAVKIVASPVTAAVKGVSETIGALRQGHSFGDAVSSGLVQAAGVNAPALSKIPAPPDK